MSDIPNLIRRNSFPAAYSYSRSIRAQSMPLTGHTSDSHCYSMQPASPADRASSCSGVENSAGQGNILNFFDCSLMPSNQ